MAQAGDCHGERERRAESALFGSGDVLKSQALEVILKTAEGMPAVSRRETFVPVTQGLSFLDSVIAETVAR